MKRILLFFYSLLFVCSIANAGNYTIQPGEQTHVDITQDVGIYYDYSHKMRLDAVRTIPDDKFFTLNGGVSDGFRDATIWIKFRLDMTNAEKTVWYLYEKWYTNEYMTLYQVNQQGEVVSSQENGVYSKTEVPFDARKISFIIDNTANQASADYYLKVRVYVPTLYGFGLATTKSYGESIANENLMFGAYFGAMVFVIFYALIMGPYLSTFYYFAAFVTSLTLWNFVANGFTRQFFGPVLTSNDILGTNFDQPSAAINMAGILVILTFIPFARKVLEHKNETEWFRKFANCSFVLAVIICTVSVFVKEELPIVIAFFYHTFIVACFAGYSLLNCFVLNKSLVTFWVTLAFIAISLSIILNNLSLLSYIQSGLISRHGLQMASGITFLWFAYVLSKRVEETQILTFKEKRKNIEYQTKQAAINRVIERIRTDLSPTLDKVSEICQSHGSGAIQSDGKTVSELVQGIKLSINKVADLVAIEMEEGHEVKDAFSIEKIIADVHAEYVAFAYRSNINFAYKHNSTLTKNVIGEREKVFKLLGLLTDNALRHSGSCSVQLTSEVSSRTDSSIIAQFSVIDRGVKYIPPNIAIVMAALSHGNYSALHDLPEECFGLRLASEIVNNLGGAIRFENKRPGLTVTVSIMFDI